MVGTVAEIAGTVAVAAGAGWAVYRERAALREGLGALAARTEPGWVIACIGVQGLVHGVLRAVAAAALRAGGARLTVCWLLSTAYLANSVAVAVPVVGLGMATTYACHQLCERRVDPVIA
jgi:hypothetical protein